jgi:Holliday junction resolvasome RuvABC endonuclease subunit
VNILALDPATHCGFAHSCGISGTWDLSTRRDESKGMKLIRLRGKLTELLKDCPFELCVFEAARFSGPMTAGALVVQSEIQGVIKLWAEDNHIEYRGFSPSEVKKQATGKGNANKDKMISAARKKWPKVQIESHDQADALWVLDLAKATLGLNGG